MHKVITLLILVFSFFSTLHSQSLCEGGRYVDRIFDCVDTTENVVYGQGLQNWSSLNLLCQNGNLPPYVNFQELRCDVYEPCGDTESQRPLLIVIHGGAWAGGDKRDLAYYCHQMAQRGYVVASISYRLSVTLNILCWNAELDEIKLHRAFYRAMQDAKAAVRFFRAHAAEWRIDPDNFFAAGHSAGAITALGLAYLRDDSERPPATFQQDYCGSWFGQPVCPDMGGIEGEGGNAAFSSAIKAVIPISGALPALDVLDGPDDPALLMVHGTLDDVVPYEEGCVLQSVRNLGLFNPCIPVYGSAALLHYADSIGMDAELMTFEGGGHGFTDPQMDSIADRSARFLCCQLHNGNCQAVGTVAASPALEVKVFPNPAHDEVTVRVASPEPWRAALYDVNGRLLEQKSSAGADMRFHLRAFAPGVYVLRMWQNDTTCVTRVIRS